MRTLMNLSLRITLSLIAISPLSVFADYLSPFSDCPAGTTVSDVASLSKGQADGEFKVSFNTDTGLQSLEAVLKIKMQIDRRLGRPILLTAKILNVKPRKLEILDVQEVRDSRSFKTTCSNQR